jgi:hypothetical protein
VENIHTKAAQKTDPPPHIVTNLLHQLSFQFREVMRDKKEMLNYVFSPLTNFIVSLWSHNYFLFCFGPLTQAKLTDI